MAAEYPLYAWLVQVVGTAAGAAHAIGVSQRATACACLRLVDCSHVHACLTDSPIPVVSIGRSLFMTLLFLNPLFCIPICKRGCVAHALLGLARCPFDLGSAFIAATYHMFFRTTAQDSGGGSGVKIKRPVGALQHSQVHTPTTAAPTGQKHSEGWITVRRMSPKPVDKRAPPGNHCAPCQPTEPFVQAHVYMKSSQN